MDVNGDGSTTNVTDVLLRFSPNVALTCNDRTCNIGLTSVKQKAPRLVQAGGFWLRVNPDG